MNVTMDKEKERKPFCVDFQNTYGTTNTANPTTTPPTTTTESSGKRNSTVYYIHGLHQPTVAVGHCHRDRLEGVDKKARKKLIIASILCLLFMIAEIIGGILSNSLAIATDAAHLLTDFAAFMISLFALWLAGRPSTQRLSFGWYRAEVIGALVSVLMIWAITAVLIWLAVNRIINKEYELEADIMLITSGLAILFNVVMGWQLHHGHGHSHGSQSSQPTQQLTVTNSGTLIPSTKNNSVETTLTNIHDKSPVDTLSLKTSHNNSPPATIEVEDSNQLQQNSKMTVKSTAAGHESFNLEIAESSLEKSQKTSTKQRKMSVAENINVRAAFIHVIGDVVQSIGVFIAALIIYFKPEYAIVDPICTFIFSVIVLFTTFKILKDAILVLMEATPDYLHYTEVMNIFLQIDGVEHVHNLRIWALSINKCALSAHLAIRPGANPRKILQDANTAVHLKYNFFETTIQIEDFTPEMEDCKQCTIPNS